MVIEAKRLGKIRMASDDVQSIAHDMWHNKSWLSNRLLAASQERYGITTINPEVGARPQAACGSTITLGA